MGARIKSTAYARIDKANAVASDPVILAALVAKNSEGESMAAVQAKDREWIAGSTALQRKLTSSECAARLRELIEDDALIVEALLMDAQGALVCASSAPSDYWQGDELKWQRTYEQGARVFVDEPAHDASTDTYAIQLSVQVLRDDRAIGALTLTLKLRGDAQPTSWAN